LPTEGAIERQLERAMNRVIDGKEGLFDNIYKSPDAIEYELKF
jgi:hypothetical protein